MNRGAETAREHQPQIRRECSGCECDTAGDVTASVYRPAMPSRVVSASAPLCAFAATRAAVQPRSRGARHPGWARYRCVFDQARGARRCSGRTSDRWGYVSSPCSIAMARVTSPARSRVLHTPSRVPRPVASERALATALAAALDGVCDIQSWGDVAAGGEWSGHRAPRDDEKTLSISKICANISSDKLWLKVV